MMGVLSLWEETPESFFPYTWTEIGHERQDLQAMRRALTRNQTLLDFDLRPSQTLGKCCCCCLSLPLCLHFIMASENTHMLSLVLEGASHWLNPVGSWKGKMMCWYATSLKYSAYTIHEDLVTPSIHSRSSLMAHTLLGPGNEIWKVIVTTKFSVYWSLDPINVKYF